MIILHLTLIKPKEVTMKKYLLFILVFVLTFVFSVYESSSQLEFLKQKAKEKLEKKIEEAIEGEDEQSDEKVDDERDEPTESPTEEGLESYSKYDFVPGDKVIFYEDFSQDAIGDFPALWYTNGSGEVMTTNKFAGKWFKLKADGLFYLEKGFNFPENFTIEFDYIPVGSEGNEQALSCDLTILETLPDEMYPVMYVPGKIGIALNISTPNGHHSYGAYADASYTLNGDYSKDAGLLKRNTVNKVCIWVQKQRFRLYLHGIKIFDIPKAFNSMPKLNQIRFMTNDECEPMISNIRIAEAGADLRSKLLNDGKIISYGIYFDSGKDIVKHESYPSIKQIAEILKSDAKINIQIVGHTDSDGSAESNIVLSKKRAEAVKNYLIKEFQIEASRISTDGKGSNEPIADNNSIEGKSKNRRVEFIKK